MRLAHRSCLSVTPPAKPGITLLGNYMSTEIKKASIRTDLRVVRWLGLLIAFAMICLGLWTIASQHYFGRTTKFGGAEVSLDGQSAVLMGLLYIALGALPLALWFRTAQVAVWWASACAVAFLALLAAMLYG